MYDNIRLIPNYSIVRSRSECDTSTTLGGFTFNLPVVPSNMETVINTTLAEQLASKGEFYIMHRFLPYTEIISFVRNMKLKNLISSISVGVKPHDYDLITELSEKRLIPDFVTIDVAHSHSILVKEMIPFIKAKMPRTFLIVGNIGSVQGVLDLESWGADCVKCFVAPGKGCATYSKTGFFSKPFSDMLEMARVASVPLISDGGIREPGHIIKALVAGASMIMVGSYFAAHIDSPGEIIMKDGKQYKTYSGSTANNQFHVEGISLELPLKGYLKDTYRDIKESIQSGISYSGGKDLSSFDNVEWERL